MALSVNSEKNVIGSGTLTTAAFTTAVGDCMVAWATNFNSGVGTTPISDSLSNTWTKITEVNGTITWNAGGSGSADLWYAVVASGKSGSTTVSFHETVAAVDGLTVINITGFTGTATLDQSVAAAKIASAVSGTFNASDTAVTTTQAAEVVLGTYGDPLNATSETEGAMGQSGTNTTTWTKFGTANWGSAWANDLAYSVVSSTGNYGPKWAITQSGGTAEDCWGATASFYDSGGGAAQDTPELYGRPEGVSGQRQMHQLLAQ